MKKNILVLLLIISTGLHAQQKRYNLVWEKAQTLSGENFSMEVPSFDKAYFNYDLEKGLIFSDQWESKGLVNESSVTATNVVYQSISKVDLKDLDLNKIPNKLVFSLENSVARNKTYTFFQLSPIIKDENGGYKKVTSFQINYKKGSDSKSALLRSNKASAVVTNSVLNSGEWYRFYVDTTGVFKLSKSFLQRLGVKVNTVDPRAIKLFGHGGRMIPYSNSVAYPYDVPENAIKFVGEEDGEFNTNDYILFYAQGPKEYNQESRTHINCYTDKTYYYINISSGNGKRIQQFNQPEGTIDLVIDTFQEYQFHEIDSYNLISLGRRWFGDKFDVDSSKEFEFNFPDLVTSEPVDLTVSVATATRSDSQMNVSVNNVAVSSIFVGGVSTPTLANGNSYRGRVDVNTSKITVGLDFDNLGNPSTIGYLDLIGIEATRKLNFDNKQFLFKNKDVASTSGIVQYNMTNTSALSEIWEVTDSYNVSNYVNTDETSTLSFTAALGSLKSYVAVSPLDYFEPKFDSKTIINNQNKSQKRLDKINIV